ncbi:hypothetical protein D3C86_1806620 [compost metagenome]
MLQLRLLELGFRGQLVFAGLRGGRGSIAAITAIARLGRRCFFGQRCDQRVRVVHQRHLRERSCTVAFEQRLQHPELGLRVLQLHSKISDFAQLHSCYSCLFCGFQLCNVLLQRIHLGLQLLWRF